MKTARSHVARVIEVLLTTGAHRATKYAGAGHVIRATRILQRGKIPGDVRLVLSIDQPNYVERQFIKRCKRAGELFPVRKIQLKFPPKKAKHR